MLSKWFKMYAGLTYVSVEPSDDPRTTETAPLYIYHDTRNADKQVTVWTEIDKSKDSVELRYMLKSAAEYLLVHGLD